MSEYPLPSMFMPTERAREHLMRAMSSKSIDDVIRAVAEVCNALEAAEAQIEARQMLPMTMPDDE